MINTRDKEIPTQLRYNVARFQRVESGILNLLRRRNSRELSLREVARASWKAAFEEDCESVHAPTSITLKLIHPIEKEIKDEVSVVHSRIAFSSASRPSPLTAAC